MKGGEEVGMGWDGMGWVWVGGLSDYVDLWVIKGNLVYVKFT